MQTRYFNSIEVKGRRFIKKADNSHMDKLQDEYNWFLSIKEIPSLRKYTPDFIYFNPSYGLEMDYYPGGDLGEILVNTSSDTEVMEMLDKLFEICQDFWGVNIISLKNFPAQPDYEAMYVNHARSRVSELTKEFLSKCSERTAPWTVNGEAYAPIHSGNFDKLELFIESSLLNDPVCIIHGDFFPSNILKTDDGFKLVDPRGKFPLIPSILGDPYYDLAKLRHSFVGGYDFIVRGKMDVVASTQKTSSLSPSWNSVSYRVNFGYNDKLIAAYFDKKVEEMGYNVNKVKFIEGLLFLTMIPCHAEDLNRQIVFYATALKKLNDFISV